MALLRLQGFAELGGQRVKAGGALTANPVQQSYPTATLTVTLRATANLAAIYADRDGLIPLANPFSADANGYWFFYVAEGTLVDVEISGAGVPQPFTLRDLGSLAAGGTGLSTVTSVFGRDGDVLAQTNDYTAAQVGFVPSGGIASTNVQSALTELASEKSDVNHTHTAATITFVSAGNISAVNVQAALAELDSEKAPVSHTHPYTDVTGLMASVIVFTPTSSIASGTVQTAIEEVYAEKQSIDVKGLANGYAGLDASALLPLAYFPAVINSVALTRVRDAGSAVGERHAINFVAGTGIQLNITDAGGGTDAIDIEIVNTAATPITGVTEFGPIGNKRTGDVDPEADDYTAAQITNTPAGSIAATTVQDAINELDTSKADSAHTHNASAVTLSPISAEIAATDVQGGLANVDANFQKTSQKGAVNGYPGLDGSGLISEAVIPSPLNKTAEIIGRRFTTGGVVPTFTSDPHPKLDFEEGTDIVITVTNDAGNDSTRVKIESTASVGGGGAPLSSTYVVIALDGSLTNERQLAVESGVLSLTDGGANANVTLGVVANGLTLAKLPQIAQGQMLGRYTAGTGNVELLAVASPLSYSGGNLGLSSANLDNVARVGVSKNSAGVNVGARRRINFIEGANITLTIADDVANEEVDVTITGAAGGSGAPTDAQYLTLATNVTLTQERVLTPEGGVLQITDAGAGLAATLAVVTNGLQFAKLQQIATARILGRTTAGSGNIEQISITAPLTLSAGVLAFDTTADLNNNARIAVRKNSGADVGERRRLNFIEGSNITLTVADDGAGEEVDITIASAGGGGTAASTTFTPYAPIAAVNVQTAIQEVVDEFQVRTEKNQNNGYAGLDSSGDVLEANLPHSLTSPMAITHYYSPLYTITPADSIAPNWNNGKTQTITLNRATTTITGFTNMQSGGTYVMQLIQDGTGGRAIVWPAAVHWPGSATPAISSAANAIDIVTFVVIGSILYGSIVTGFA